MEGKGRKGKGEGRREKGERGWKDEICNFVAKSEEYAEIVNG